MLYISVWPVNMCSSLTRSNQLVYSWTPKTHTYSLLSLSLTHTRTHAHTHTCSHSLRSISDKFRLPLSVGVSELETESGSTDVLFLLNTMKRAKAISACGQGCKDTEEETDKGKTEEEASSQKEMPAVR